MNFIDSQIEPLRNVLRTPEGYLTADASAVRSGIQRYLGSEVGRPDLDFVDVYRPEEEVFRRESVATFAHKPITIDHPPGGVDAASWRDKAVGEVSTEAMRDGERLKLQLIIKDHQAVEQVLKGARRELSAGYTCKLEWQDGETADGKPYQAIQRDIQVNHLALVAKGRAGNCMIGDSGWGIAPLLEDGFSEAINKGFQAKETTMTTKSVVLGDKAVHVVAEDAEHVTAHVAKLNSQLADARTASETKDGEIAALKKQLEDARMTPEKLAKFVADRAIIADGYKALTGKAINPLASDADLRREAVSAKLGDEAVKAMSDDAIAGAFTALTADKAGGDPLRSGASYRDENSFNDADTASIFTLAGVPMKKEA